jgi:hypothetical protein
MRRLAAGLVAALQASGADDAPTLLAEAQEALGHADHLRAERVL